VRRAGPVRPVASLAVRILLPPSETKSAGGRGRPLIARDDSGPLAEPRAAVLQALRALLRTDPAAAARALLLPPGMAAGALAANAEVTESPTTAALRRYTGVVYDGLAFSALSPAAQRIAVRTTLIFSGLFGVLRGDEPVPSYRVPAKATLPGLGVAGTFWRGVLDTTLPPMLGRGLVIDLRSSDYSAMWRPEPGTASRPLTVRVFSPTASNGHKMISFPSKLAKGMLAAALVTRAAHGEAVESVDDVIAAWHSCDAAAMAIPRENGLDLYTA
jgi:uncharacterized protein